MRLTLEDYFMGIAQAVALRSNCRKRQVGAIVVVDGRVVSTGYNGTPSGMRNCFDGGCDRCNSDVAMGEGYEECVCVHAEENAIYMAARHGIALRSGILYSTLRPCKGCVKAAIQTGIEQITFGEEWMDELPDDYQLLTGRIPRGVHALG